ncbi:MAG: 3'-5' exonuclease [Bacteroidia bacterium]|nr:3'-5' exonuclease [Bacteroidia bacterium]
MLYELRTDKILFLDIETVPMTATAEEAPEAYRKLWEEKFNKIQNKRPGEDTPEKAWRSAGIYAEFGKIICISVGTFNQGNFLIKSLAGHDERKILEDLARLLEQSYARPEARLCAHNGKEFDFPYIARRMMIHGIRLPSILNLAGKKPWEVQLLDTMELWKFGDYKSYTSLNLLATVLGVPTPKDDIDGSQVYGVYYHEKDLPRIVTYCQKDVLTVAQILRRMRGEEILPVTEVVQR